MFLGTINDKKSGGRAVSLLSPSLFKVSINELLTCRCLVHFTLSQAEKQKKKQLVLLQANIHRGVDLARISKKLRCCFVCYALQIKDINKSVSMVKIVTLKPSEVSRMLECLLLYWESMKVSNFTFNLLTSPS